MRCAVCGSENIDHARFCTTCGAPLTVGTAGAEPGTPAPQAPGAPQPGHASARQQPAPAVQPSARHAAPAPGRPERRRKRAAIIAAAAVAVLALIGAAAFLVLRGAPTAPAGSAAPEQSSSKTEIAAVFKLSSVKDSAFKAYLKEKVDTDHDGGISQAEADAVTAIGSADQDPVKGNGLAGLGIADVSELAHFKNLQTLVIADNALTQLDLSGNPGLQVLICGGNQLTALDLSGTSGLTKLSVPGNKIGSLDLSGEAQLGSVDVSNNQMTGLRLPAGDALTSLNATGNAFSSLDLSQCGGLADVQVDPGANIIGRPFTDASAQSSIADLIDLYVSASGDSGKKDWSAPARMGPGNGEIDGRIIFKMFNHSKGRDLGLASTEAGGYAFIPPESVKKTLASFYGTAPDDFTYMVNQSNGISMQDGAIVVSHADGGPWFETHVSSWRAYGNTVIADADIDFNSDGQPSATRVCSARFTLVRDENSVYGYHLVSAARR